MAEYIEKEATKEAFKSIFTHVQNETFVNSLKLVACEIMDKVAVADVQAVKHGRWELTDNPSFRKCSECGAWWSSDITDNCFTKYCPKCGARMKQED